MGTRATCGIREHINAWLTLTCILQTQTRKCTVKHANEPIKTRCAICTQGLHCFIYGGNAEFEKQSGFMVATLP